MHLREMGEFGFIRRIARGCLVRPEGVLRGIGDDAAAFRSDGRLVSLITTDMLIERVHFLRRATSGYDLGHKSLAVNLSDIAAMGGTAREAFVSIAIPPDCGMDFLDGFYAGMKDLCAKYAVNILGGDTTGSKGDLAISVTVYGCVPEEQMLRRDTARPGDVVFSTGCLGDSRAGLKLILDEVADPGPELDALLAAHRRPEPHLREGRFLAARPGVHAAIDVSDGLSSDLGHIAEESAVGARLYADKIPVSAALAAFARRFRVPAVEMALAGGEDYVLLVTAEAARAEIIAQDFREAFGRPLHAIGEITAGRGLELTAPGGRSVPLKPSGWDHFRDGEPAINE